MDDVHSAGVFGWIEQPNVTLVHMQVWEPTTCGSLLQDLAGVLIPLNSNDWFVSEDKIGKQAASDAGKNVHCLHSSSSLIHQPRHSDYKHRIQWVPYRFDHCI
jgi:hypothetical protein